MRGRKRKYFTPEEKRTAHCEAQRRYRQRHLEKERRRIRRWYHNHKEWFKKYHDQVKRTAT